MDYDKKILECVKTRFKTVKEISEETGIPYCRVSIRINKLKKYGFFDEIQSNTDNKGVKPLKYKQKINSSD